MRIKATIACFVFAALALGACQDESGYDVNDPLGQRLRTMIHARSWCAWGDPRGYETLVRATFDEHEYVRIEALLALEDCRGDLDEKLWLLRRIVVQDPAPWPRVYADQVEQRLTGRPKRRLHPNLLQLLREWERQQEK